MKIVFDLKATPYSVRGSDLALIDSKFLTVHSAVQTGHFPQVYIKFFFNNKLVTPTYEVFTNFVKATYANASLEMCFYGKGAIAMKNRGFKLKFEPYQCEKYKMEQDKFYTYSVKYDDGHYETVSCNQHYFADYYFYSGDGEFVRKHNFPFAKKGGNCFLISKDADFMFGFSDEQQRFDDIVFDLPAFEQKIEENWLDFLSKMPNIPQKYVEFAKMTWFTLWANMVPKSRHYQQDAVVMGMVGMPAIWSWDHCFNALATDFYSFETGWTQFEAPYRYQFDNGALPDAFSNSHFYIGIVKPPIHGWCFAKLMERHPDLPSETLQKAFDYLEKQANFWIKYRDSDNDGLPDYPQGCDSGMDNGTVFIDPKKPKNYRRFVECPDLPAYLALQFDTLAKICEKLGKDGNEFIKKRDDIIAKMIAHFGRENGFVSLSTHDHVVNTNAHCVIDLVPLVLGKLLPVEWKNKTINKLQSENLTKYGIASESPKSIYYRPDGYWRGPIWAPTTYLIIDGLRKAGEMALAKDLTEKYLDLVVNVAKGNYENYDAISGKGLCVKGHTWTASVTMLLMHELCLETNN